MLLSAGTAAAVGVVAAFGTGTAQAQGTVEQECMTITYQNGPDVRFNFDYYVNTHMPLIIGSTANRSAGSSCAAACRAPTMQRRRMSHTITIWIAEGKTFDEAQVEHQAGLRADVPKFTNAFLIAQRDRIVGTAAS